MPSPHKKSHQSGGDDALAIDGSQIVGQVIELGATGSGNRDCIFDLHGDDTYTDYGVRLWRQNTGANANSGLYHRGTGALQLHCSEAGIIEFLTGGSQRAYFDSGGILQFTASVQDKIVFFPTAYKMGIEAFGLYFETNNNVNDHFAFKAAGTEVFRIQSQGNIGINTGTFGTNAVAVLAIKSSTAPTSSPTDTIQIWAEDVAGSHEARVRDEAGNVATFSPHNFTLFQPDPSFEFPWSYYAQNDYIGKEINVDMFGAIRALEKLTGQQFIYLNDIPKRNWDEDQVSQIQKRQDQIDEVLNTLSKMRNDIEQAETVEEKQKILGEIQKIKIPEPLTSKQPPLWMRSRINDSAS